MTDHLADAGHAAGVLTRFDAATSAVLALMLQGEDPGPVLGELVTADQAAVAGAILSTARAAIEAIHAAATCTEHSTPTVANLDTARLWNALAALNTRAAELHNRADQLT